VNFEINGPELIGLIGPNGAGKTTMTNILDGAIKPTSGTVYLGEKRIDQLQPFEVARAGLGRTFQVTRSFRRMTVLENLYVPALAMGNTHGQAELRDKAMGVLEFLTIDHLRNEYAQALSGGQQKLLELGRTMMVDARVVFLDEVGAGVNRTLLNTIGDAILRLNKERGYTFCLIEHDMDFIARLCDPVIVMAEGKVLAQGSATEIMQNEAVIEAYLGTGLKNKMKAAAQ